MPCRLDALGKPVPQNAVLPVERLGWSVLREFVGNRGFVRHPKRSEERLWPTPTTETNLLTTTNFPLVLPGSRLAYLYIGIAMILRIKAMVCDYANCNPLQFLESWAKNIILSTSEVNA